MLLRSPQARKRPVILDFVRGLETSPTVHFMLVGVGTVLIASALHRFTQATSGVGRFDAAARIFLALAMIVEGLGGSSGFAWAGMALCGLLAAGAGWGERPATATPLRQASRQASRPGRGPA